MAGSAVMVRALLLHTGADAKADPTIKGKNLYNAERLGNSVRMRSQVNVTHC